MAKKFCASCGLPDVSCGCPAKKRDIHDLDNWAGTEEGEVFETKASKAKHVTKAEKDKALEDGLNDLARRVAKADTKKSLDDLAAMTQEMGGYEEFAKKVDKAVENI